MNVPPKGVKGFLVPGLKAARQRRIMTLRALSKASGVSANTLVRLESGDHGAQPRTINAIARALGIEPRDLLGPPDAG